MTKQLFVKRAIQVLGGDEYTLAYYELHESKTGYLQTGVFVSKSTGMVYRFTSAYKNYIKMTYLNDIGIVRTYDLYYDENGKLDAESYYKQVESYLNNK